MKTKLYFLFTLVLALSLMVGTLRAQAATGFHINGRYLLDANGNNFIMRGINHAHTWYPTQTSSFANIKNAAANTVRVVLSNGGRWTKNDASDVANVIQLCKTNKLICVLEVHDTTGYGEDAAAVSLSQAVSYWQEIQSVLTGQEAYVIINIGNEPYGNINASGWINDTKNAIIAMRNAGFHHTLMVDAPNWGQDWQFIMRNNAASVFNSDPDRNTIFSIHMYAVFDTTSEIQNYISTFVNNRLPLVIGEFGDNAPDGNPNEDVIMSTAQSNGIGYMGWSWSGNGGGVEYLDMVTNFDPAQRTSWGTRIITGANGLQQTSQESSVYGSPTPTPTPTNTPTPTPAPGNTGWLNPAANASQTGGDGNGYEVSAANAYTNDGLFTVDNNSGTNSNSSCTNSGKDKHRFYNYNVTIPNGVAVKGIQVRVDAKADSISGSPKICVQLSWDGGSTWTSTKSTPTLTAVKATYILGGTTDTWGHVWTANQLSNTSFRMRVIDVATSTARDFSLDWVAVQVTYR